MLETGNRHNSKLAIRVLTDRADSGPELQRALAARFGSNSASSSVILRWLEQQNDVAPEVWVALAERLPRASNYFDVVEALRVLESRAADLADVRLQVEALLRSDDGAIAARAREFLGEW